MSTEKCPYCGSTQKLNDLEESKDHHHCGVCGRIWARGVTQASVYWKKGIIEGINRYAWWKDGIQYVGNPGKTLKEAIEEVEWFERLMENA